MSTDQAEDSMTCDQVNYL